MMLEDPCTRHRPRYTAGGPGGAATHAPPGRGQALGREFGPRGEAMPSDTVGVGDLLELSDLLLKWGKVRLRIASRSMVPTLRPGDEIGVDPVSVEALRTGDVILFELKGQLICHRLVEMPECPSALLTRGDAASSGGLWIGRDQVLGKVVSLRRRSLWVGIRETLHSALAPSLYRWLPDLQRLTPYRVLMRTILAPFLSYHLGVAQATRWYDWQELRKDSGLPVLPRSPRSHLLIAKRGKGVVGCAFLVCDPSGWQCENVSVRLRYRGLGIESALARWAHLLCNTK